MSQKTDEDVSCDIFLVDGGSTDGTPDAVREQFPSVHCYVENGLYWAGGMRWAWREAVSYNDGYDFLDKVLF